VDVPFISSPPSNEGDVRVPVPSGGANVGSTPGIKPDFREDVFGVQYYFLAVSIGNLVEFAASLRKFVAFPALRKNKVILVVT
jgi:hypothetical protein